MNLLLLNIQPKIINLRIAFAQASTIRCISSINYLYATLHNLEIYQILDRTQALAFFDNRIQATDPQLVRKKTLHLTLNNDCQLTTDWISSDMLGK